MTRLHETHRRINAEIAQENRAHHARLALLIQREAVGLRHHRIVDQQFPEPPRRAASRRPPGT